MTESRVSSKTMKKTAVSHINKSRIKTESNAEESHSTAGKKATKKVRSHVGGAGTG